MTRIWGISLVVLVLLAGVGLVRNGIIGFNPQALFAGASGQVARELSHLDAPEGIAAFYRERAFAPLWVDGGKLRPEALRLAEGSASLAALVKAAENGDAAARARLEAALSVEFVRQTIQRAGQTAALDFVDPDLQVSTDPKTILQHAAKAPSLPALVASVKDGNPVETDLRRGLELYRAAWSRLPQDKIPFGPGLSVGDEGERVAKLRRRLGLAAGQAFDAPLAAAVSRFQAVHGLTATGAADIDTLGALNAGAGHFERLIALNIQRAAALPPSTAQRFVLVNVPAAKLWLYENGKPVRDMKVIVGEARHATPMMAGLIRYAVFNPYWNIPPDIVQETYAPKALAAGPGYLQSARLEALSDWSDQATPLAPNQIDWRAVAKGQTELRLRQLPGAENAMGKVKFMLPNELGIYLHDTPQKGLFERTSRLLSAGCVRLEDAPAVVEWLMGHQVAGAPKGLDQHIDLAEATPVYITYLTAAADPARGGAITFLPDVYGRDRPTGNMASVKTKAAA